MKIVIDNDGASALADKQAYTLLPARERIKDAVKLIERIYGTELCQPIVGPKHLYYNTK